MDNSGKFTRRGLRTGYYQFMTAGAYREPARAQFWMSVGEFAQELRDGAPVAGGFEPGAFGLQA